MSQFEANKTYTGRFICDSDSTINMTIIKRTAKTVVANVEGEGEKRMRIQLHDGVEFVYPLGSGYSMCPRIRAA